MKLRNQTFVCTAKVRNVMKLLKCVSSRGPRLVESFVHYENVTNQKIKVTMQTTTKTSFLTISVLEIMLYCGDSNLTKERIHDVNN